MIEVNNLTHIKINEKLLKKIAGKVLKNERKDLDLSIALVSHKEIENLNRKYRKKNRTTDVLSFLYNSLGEVVICPQVIIKNAEKLREKFERELIQVLIHGILHLLGYDHEISQKKTREMEKKQNYYLKLCSVAKIRPLPNNNKN